MLIEDMKAANAQRDASTLYLFEEVLARMLEAEQELIRACQADTADTPNREAIEAARERVNRHRGALVDAYKHSLASNSNMFIKLLEIKALEPPKPIIVPIAGSLIDAEPGKWHTFTVQVRADEITPPNLAQVAASMRDMLKAETVEVFGAKLVENK